MALDIVPLWQVSGRLYTFLLYSICFQRMYEDLDCEFLLNENDPVNVYMQKNADELEEKARDPETELYDEVALRTNADIARNVVTGKHMYRD
jgi:hypothetical protein